MKTIQTRSNIPKLLLEFFLQKSVILLPTGAPNSWYAAEFIQISNLKLEGIHNIQNVKAAPKPTPPSL